MLNRTQSFQNCRETDVPGYNDCPNFIYPSKGASGARKARFSVEDTCGNTKPAVAPPPPVRRVKSQQETATPFKGKSELLEELDRLFACNSNLPPAEFQYHKNKVLTNIDQSLSHDHGCQVMSRAMTCIGEKEQLKKVIMEWMMSDTSTSKWCPSFLKIAGNVAL